MAISINALARLLREVYEQHPGLSDTGWYAVAKAAHAQLDPRPAEDRVGAIESRLAELQERFDNLFTRVSALENK